jgi:hypothetical protein
VKTFLARLGRVSPAMIVAMIALFVALSGTAVATTSALITGRQIQNNSITGLDIKQKSIQVGDLATRARGTRGARGVAGPPGPVGPQGAQGPPGPSTGPAGGALAGAYPNPSIAAAAVRASHLGAITRRSAVSPNIAAGANGNVTANCNAGERVIGGGNDGFLDVWIAASRDNGANGWTVFGHNESAANRTITAHVYCLAG